MTFACYAMVRDDMRPEGRGRAPCVRRRRRHDRGARGRSGARSARGNDVIGTEFETTNTGQARPLAFDRLLAGVLLVGALGHLLLQPVLQVGDEPVQVLEHVALDQHRRDRAGGAQAVAPSCCGSGRPGCRCGRPGRASALRRPGRTPVRRREGSRASPAGHDELVVQHRHLALRLALQELSGPGRRRSPAGSRGQASVERLTGLLRADARRRHVAACHRVERKMHVFPLVGRRPAWTASTCDSRLAEAWSEASPSGEHQ